MAESNANYEADVTEYKDRPSRNNMRRPDVSAKYRSRICGLTEGRWVLTSYRTMPGGEMSRWSGPMVVAPNVPYNFGDDDDAEADQE